MNASWFRKHGYRSGDRIGVRELVWKPFVDDAEEPRWVMPKPVPESEPGQVEVPVHLTTVDTSDRDTVVRRGHSDEVFVGAGC